MLNSKANVKYNSGMSEMCMCSMCMCAVQKNILIIRPRS